MTTPDERPPFRLADEERAGLLSAYQANMPGHNGWPELLAHVTDLCESYHAAGLVEGDLAHDGTIRAEVEAR